jgi:hypothetical protein
MGREPQSERSEVVNGLKHPFGGALYEQDGQGNILVTQGDKSGLFKGDGRWISGELRQADPQLCNWVAGPMLGNHRLSTRAGTAKS